MSGIHHITAIASDAATCVDFYSRVLGLRLVKKTVNQDDVRAYHLFFGDREGMPGLDLTFFIFNPMYPGERGCGVVSLISLSVPIGSLDFWRNRFESEGVIFEDVVERWGKKRIVFYDRDGQRLELVESDYESDDVWITEDVGMDVAIRSFESAGLQADVPEAVAPILTEVFGYVKQDEVAGIELYELAGEERAGRLEIWTDMDSWARSGAGTVHHIAFRAKDDEDQKRLRTNVLRLGLRTTEVIDRYYFKSVYFQTPAGILFEIATDGPGFIADEELESLGERLSLPPFLEDRREDIERGLPDLLLEDE